MYAFRARGLQRPLSQLCKPACATSRWLSYTSLRNCSCSVPQKDEPSPQDKDQVSAPQADHRQLGKSLDLFGTTTYSPGSPLFHPDGSHIFLRLQAMLRAQYQAYGFQEVVSPIIYKQSLWEKSGHWQNYKDDMYEVVGRGARGTEDNGEIGEDESYGLKPMNCPGHCLIYKSQKRSYRDLPIRYADFSPLHRNEVSGALSGLTRVRRFHQDDGHIFCRPSQVGEEIGRQIQLVGLVYKALGFEDYKLVLSTRPETSFIGTIEEWDRAEAQLKEALSKNGAKWDLSPGDGAFYGPKIDIVLKDNSGKEHQTATIQLDFQLPQRFDLTYSAPAPEFESRGEITTDTDLLAKAGDVRPVIIHRAILGSLERFMALLTEQCQGKWPYWLSPRQIMIIGVDREPETMAWVNRVLSILSPDSDHRRATLAPMHLLFGGTKGAFTKLDLDLSKNKLRQKIAAARKKQYNIIVAIGKDDAKNKKMVVDFSGTPRPEEVAKSFQDVSGRLVNSLHGSKTSMSLVELTDFIGLLERRYL